MTEPPARRSPVSVSPVSEPSTSASHGTEFRETGSSKPGHSNAEPFENGQGGSHPPESPGQEAPEIRRSSPQACGIDQPEPVSPETYPPGQDHPHPARRRWMAVLARAEAAAIAARLEHCLPLPGYARLRGPESGLVMVRGRAGGSGAAFNLGEMTVTRCSVRTDQGAVGHAYLAGRDARRAELAAVVDAMMQDPARAAQLEEQVITPLEVDQRRIREQRASRAAATKVQFFAMQTMRT